MALIKRVTKYGNSAGLIFDQPVLKQLGWEIGTEVQFDVKGDQLVLSPHRYATDDEAEAAGAKVIGARHRLIERLAKR